MNKFCKIINKYLKKESEEIGFKIYYKFLTSLIKIESQTINEINLLIYNELLIYINENSQRIIEIWENNKNSKINQKILSKNSLQLLSYCIYLLINFYKDYNNYIKNNPQNCDYLVELKRQNDKLLENIKKIMNSMKIIEKESMNDNSKSILLEKYYNLITQSFYLLFILKEKNLNKEELELIFCCFIFSIKNTLSSYTTLMSIKYFDNIIESRKNIIQYNDKNQNSLEIIKNWKIYFNENTYFKNKYISESRYNIIIKYFIKYYSYCFNKQINNEQFQIFKDISKKFVEDKYNIFKNFIKKLNDFKINFEYKIQMIYLIQIFYEWNKNYIFSDLYFFLKEIASFYCMFSSLNNEFIGEHIKEEKIEKKEILQKNILKISIEDNDNIDNIVQKKNLNSLFLILLTNKYDKYIYMEDQNQLTEFMKLSLKLWKFLIDIFKYILSKENNLEKKAYIIDKVSVPLSEFFYFFFCIFEKYQVNHQTHDNKNEIIDNLIEIYILSLSKDLNLFTTVFKKLMPYIFKLYRLGCKICPIKNCVLTKIIHNIFKTVKDPNIREILFSIYFEYFSAKIYEAGNPIEIFKTDSNGFSNTSFEFGETINTISILKSIFYNLLDSITNFEYFNNSIIPLIIDVIYLSKNSEYYGNYIYILRCFFKYLKSAISSQQNANDNREQNELEKNKKINSDFNDEIYSLLYAIIKYLVKIKEKIPFLSDIILEIIMIIPIKMKYLIQMPQLIFPSLVDSLNNNVENTTMIFENLENWMTLYIKNPETVLPFLQQNISKIIDLLSSNLHNSVTNSLSLTSLKLITKLGEKGRNYLKIKQLITKTFPMQIICVKLRQKNSENTLDLILDNIIDIDIDNIINLNSRTLHKKTGKYDKKVIYNIIEIYKNCLLAFFHKKIDYNYIIEIKKNIINKINFNQKEFISNFSFKIMNEKNSKIKINNIFRKKEHFLIQKILARIFYLSSSFTQLQNNQKDKSLNGDNLIKFITDYFLLILLSKEKNNKNVMVFEIDPIMIIDEIILFLFTTNPIIIKNTNIQLSEYSIKLIKNIIDSINKFFDYNNKIIKELEIVEIIYMKFISCCYHNDFQRKDSGLILLKCLLQNFDKSINYKYLKYFFKCISSIASNYSNIIKIKFKKGCNHLVEVIDYLIKIFVINDENYLKLKEEFFEDDKNINEEKISDNEKNILINSKNNFIMLFDFIKYCFDEIVERFDSMNSYTRNIGIYLTEKILGNVPNLKKILPLLFQIDISKLSVKEFYKYFKESYNILDYSTLIFNCNNNFNITINNEENKFITTNKKYYILDNFNISKIYNKIKILFKGLTKKIDLRETNLTHLISYSDSLNHIFNICPILINEFVIENENNFQLYLEVIKTLYYNLLINYFCYLQISLYFEKSGGFRTKLMFLFIEKLLENKNFEFNFKIKNDEGEEIIFNNNEVKKEYIEYFEKFVYENDVYRNEVNTRDFLIGEFFEFLELRINMMQQYIKLLNNFYNKINFNNISLDSYYKEEFYKYKIKITKLIFIKIFNIRTSLIIKECSSFLYNILKNDSKLEENINKEFYNKINDYIEKINDKNIKNSNCAINQDIISGLQNNHINTLLIICKCMKLNNKMLEELNKKIFVFEKHFNEKKYENSQFILFYGYISIFLHIETNEEKIKIIFKHLLNRIKETYINMSKHLLLFTQTNYQKKIIKLIIKYRKYFSRFIIEMYSSKQDHKYIFKFIQLLGAEDRNAFIFEQILNDIVCKIKNEILINKNNSNENIINNDINKLTYFLKIYKIISWISPIYLRKSKLMEIIDDYMKKIIINYDNNYEKLQENLDYEKIMKYWIDLNNILIKNFKNISKYLLSLFFFLSRKNVSKIEKNKISFFLQYNTLLIINEKNYEKNFKNIINYFIELDEETIKYFDKFTEYLIIPLIIKYFKHFNYFKCFSISINEYNSINIDIEKKENYNNDKNIETIKNENNNKDSENNKECIEDNNNSQIKNEKFILNFLEILTFKLNNIIFDDEKKEVSKYKLLSIVIVIYLEYINKKENNVNYNEKTTNIYYNIQTLLSNSPYINNKKALGLFRIYLLLDIILFSKQKEKEENITTIFNFYKNLNEEYNDVQNLAYEIIIPNIQNQNLLEQILKLYYSEGGIFNILKIILKFPNIINKLTYSFIKIILSNIYELASRISNNISYKKILLQSIAILGLLTKYISNKRDSIKNSDNENSEIKYINEIANFIFNVIIKLYKIFLNNDDRENLDTDIQKKLLFCLREILNSKINFQMIIPTTLPIELMVKNIHYHIQLLRIYIFYIEIEIIYKNLSVFLHYHQIIYERNVNSRIFNDFCFVFRCLTDEKLLTKINNKSKPNEYCLIEYRLQMMDYIEKIIKDKNNMSKKYTNYDIKDLFLGNNNYDNIFKKVLNYLIYNRLFLDRNSQNNNINQQAINNQNNHNYQQQNNPNANNPINNININNQQNSNIRSSQQNNNINHSQQQQIYIDKWLETFHLNDFKYFIFFRKFALDFYSSLPETIKNINNLNINEQNEENKANIIQNLKLKLVNKLKEQNESIELIYTITYSFFENFFCFTLFFLNEYKFLFENNYKKIYLNKEFKEYFSTSHNFYFNLRDFDELQKIKKEDFDFLINDPERNKNFSLNLINNFLMFYPDIILSGFYFFFDCKEIVEKYYNDLLKLFSYSYRFFRDKYYDNLLEHLLNKILYNEYLKDKLEEKNAFIFKLLISIELVNTYRIIKTSENISEIIINYLQYQLTISNANKKDPNINKSLHILLFNSIKFDFKNRKKIFELIKSYTGNTIMDSLKWLFTFDDDIDNDIYSFIYYESIIISIEFLLTYFEEEGPLILNTNNYSKFKNLENNKKNIENNDYIEYDKNNYIKNIVDNCNLITKEKKLEDLLDPIKSIILSENCFCFKLFTHVFTQIWKILTMQEREDLTLYFNEFLYKFTLKEKEINTQIINLLFDTFSQCSPVIYIKPIIIQSLAPYYNLWGSNILYFENLLMSGIDVTISYNSLINLFNSMKEYGISNGLQYYFSKNKNSKEAFSQLQINNYLNAENIFYDCFNKFETNILDKININNFNIDNNDNINLSNDDFGIFFDLASWENGLIECYENNEKWNNIIELSNINNNNELKLEGLWFSGYEKWNYLNEYIKTISQYENQDKNNSINLFFVRLNEIYSNFNNIIAELNPIKDNVKKYKDICIECIKKFCRGFSLLYPNNAETLNYYYYLIFQLNVESWESTNVLQTIIKKTIIEKKEQNLKDDFFQWRERLPHYCEGIKSLKCILEPRNNFFDKLQKLLTNNNTNSNNNFYIPNYIDKTWTDMIILKYLRKLNLTETFYEKLKIFEEEYRNKIEIFPYEIYCKDIEYIKFIKKNICNYDLGIKICDRSIYTYNLLKQENIKDLVSYAINEFKEYKAYFYYKKGDINEAHKLFMESSLNNKNKENTNYHLYYDWAEMCEEISLLIKGEEEVSEWFENTIHNFLYTIIYKLDKAKFIIPRMITFIKEFPNEILKDRFNDEINQIPPWVWIFYLPELFENFNYYEKDNNKNDFFFIILKKVANKYKQLFYYPYNIYQKNLKDVHPLNDKYKELKNITYSENEYDHCIDKIQIIIDELTKKENENQENSLNTILNICEIQTFRLQKFSEIKTFFKTVDVYLKNYPDLVQIRNNFEELMNNPLTTRNQIRECIIKYKYYKHNLFVTQNKYKQLSKLYEEKIYNIDFSNIELPGYFSNKIMEPTEQNMLFISNFEIGNNCKFINDARTKVLIKCSNDKLLNYIIVNKDASRDVDMKIYKIQILFNFIFAKNYQTYKRKIRFITSIKYHISSKIKIVEEDINIKYNMDEIYEYCLQKRGYSPKIANQIFEEEAKKLNVNTDLVYYSSENNEKLFYKMCKIIPQDSLKNFIHKFLLNSEDILLFRRQFTISYSINSLTYFTFFDNILLKNISFNKENGFCSFNTDLNLFTGNQYKEIIEQIEGTPLRLSKNISFFLSIISIYGIMPEIFYFSCDSLLKKSNIIKSIFKIFMNNLINKNDNIDTIVNNYINKIQFILNNDLFNDKNNNKNRNNNNNEINLNQNKEENVNNNINKVYEEFDNKQKSMKIIYKLIDNSMDNDNLKKKTIDYEAWF